MTKHTWETIRMQTRGINRIADGREKHIIHTSSEVTIWRCYTCGVIVPNQRMIEFNSDTPSNSLLKRNSISEDCDMEVVKRILGS